MSKVTTLVLIVNKKRVINVKIGKPLGILPIFMGVMFCCKFV